MALWPLAVALTLGGVLAWLAPGGPRARAALAAATCGVVLATDRVWPRALPESQVRNRPIQVEDDGYVSSSACRACHPDQYASWHASWHRTMTQRATPETVLGDFDGVEVDADGRRYRLERDGDAFWVEMDDPERAAPGGPRVRRRILVTTGAHHEQDYWYETGHTRRLGFLPLMWLKADARWVPFRAGFLQPPDLPSAAPAEMDRWQTTCIRCHATHGRPRTSTSDPERDMDTTVAELGIACEACHGPGAQHVAANQGPWRRLQLRWRGEADETIVNPRRLSPEREAQVCGQCHAIHRPLELMPREARRPDDWRDHGLAYRPGDDLEATRFLVRPERVGSRRMQEILYFDPQLLQDRFWPDGMVRVSGREYHGLLDSPCYREGRGERRLTCRSCHAMHVEPGDVHPLSGWADDQLRIGMDGNAACAGCHPLLATGEASAVHSHHAVDSPGSECMNCHMPHTTYGLLKAIRSHTISSPSVAESRDAGRPNACNLCHLDRTLAWTGEHLAQGWGQPRQAIPAAMAAVPASLVWALAGDAGQRALAAWSMGWAPALGASRADSGWLAEILAVLLNDPYDAVRYLAGRALVRQPGFADFSYDYVGEPEARRAAAQRALLRFSALRGARGDPVDGRALLDDPQGRLGPRLFERLLAERNDARVWLKE